MSRTDPPRTRTNPQDVRGKHFTVRLRGLDPDEGRYFLAGLADDLEGILAQVATLTQENETLTQENQLLHPCSRRLGQTDGTGHRSGRERPQPGSQLADSLIDEAMQSARDLLLTARSQQRDIMEQAKVAASGAVSRATAIAERGGGQDASVRDVEYVRMFARVAQVQF
jgi:DivIVA domain-containing protein